MSFDRKDPRPLMRAACCMIFLSVLTSLTIGIIAAYFNTRGR